MKFNSHFKSYFKKQCSTRLRLVKRNLQLNKLCIKFLNKHARRYLAEVEIKLTVRCKKPNKEKVQANVFSHLLRNFHRFY